MTGYEFYNRIQSLNPKDNAICKIPDTDYGVKMIPYKSKSNSSKMQLIYMPTEKHIANFIFDMNHKDVHIVPINGAKVKPGAEAWVGLNLEIERGITIRVFRRHTIYDILDLISAMRKLEVY